MSSFWSKWMIGLSFLVMLMGICFAIVFPYFMPQALEPFFTEITGMPLSAISESEIRFHNLLSAVMGGTMFGWGLLLVFLGYRLLKKPEDWIWSAVALSIVGWYCLDTLASILAGSMLNVILNTSILLLAAPPIIASRKVVISGFKKLAE